MGSRCTRIPTHSEIASFVPGGAPSCTRAESTLGFWTLQNMHTLHRGEKRPGSPNFLPHLTTGEDIRQPGQSQIGGCTCRIPLDISVFRLFPARRAEAGPVRGRAALAHFRAAVGSGARPSPQEHERPPQCNLRTRRPAHHRGPRKDLLSSETEGPGERPPQTEGGLLHPFPPPPFARTPPSPNPSASSPQIRAEAGRAPGQVSSAARAWGYA